MSGTSATPTAHSGATFVKAEDAPVIPAAAAPAAAPAAAAPVVAAVAPVAPSPAPAAVIGAVADPAAAVVADPAKTDPAKTDPNAKDPAKTDPVVEVKPEDYKITFSTDVPDGAKDPLVAGFLPVAAKLGLSNDQVQAIIDQVGPVVRDQQNNAWTALQTQWQTDFKADAKIGGVNFDATVARLNGAITSFADDANHAKAIGQALQLTGAGNNVPLMKWINTMAVRLSEGTPVNGNVADQRQAKSAGDILYDNPTSKPGASATRG